MKNRKLKPIPSNTEEPIPALPRLSAADVSAAGKSLRDKVARLAHAAWKRPADRANPLDILRASDAGRQAQLLPIRYGRMLQTPFTFYRGAAAVMAADLAKTPATGIRVQACGDCHLLNFGGFATPERNILFDINDFDETLPAPWEWDVKRLVASFVLAARSNGLSDADGRDAAVACARSYREHMREYAEMSPLEVWYARIDCGGLSCAGCRRPASGARARQRIAKAKAQSGIGARLSAARRNGRRPHPHSGQPAADLSSRRSAGQGFPFPWIENSLAEYRKSLADDRRVLLDRYRIVDAAMKVVGIGSVGTRCAIVLMMSIANEPLFLQCQGGREIRPGALCRQERLSAPRPAGGDGPTADAACLGHLSRLGDRRHGRHTAMCGNCATQRSSRWWRPSTPRCWPCMARLAGGRLARAHAKAGNPLTDQRLSRIERSLR